MATDDWTDWLTQTQGPRLLIGEPPRGIVEDSTTAGLAFEQRLATLDAVLSLPADARFALAVVVSPLDGPADREDPALARLRDLLADRVLLITRDQDALTTRLRSLGYRILGRHQGQLAAGFDLHDYKQRPSWLNARHWANPENWDRFRW